MMELVRRYQRCIYLYAEYIISQHMWFNNFDVLQLDVRKYRPFPVPKPHDTLFFLKGKVRKVACWWWKISVFHWCQLAIHSHDNAHVLDSDSGYTWMIMRWWVWASVCHETSMTEWWEWERTWSRPVPPHYTPTNLSSLGVNENNRAYSEMDAPFVNSVIRETHDSQFHNFWLIFFHSSVMERFPFTGSQGKVIVIDTALPFWCMPVSYTAILLYSHFRSHTETNWRSTAVLRAREL